MLLQGYSRCPGLACVAQPLVCCLHCSWLLQDQVLRRGCNCNCGEVDMAWWSYQVVPSGRGVGMRGRRPRRDAVTL